jgi:hypothetical protein
MNWTKVSNKRSSSPSSDTVTEAKHSKESEYWLNRPSGHFQPLRSCTRGEKQRRTAENRPRKHTRTFSNIYNWSSEHITNDTGVRTNSKRTYDIEALADTQAEVQPKTVECYGTIVTAVAERHTELHTYKRKEVRSYRVVSQICNMQYSIDPDDMNVEIEKLGHTVTNVWNIKQYRTNVPLSMLFCRPEPSTK